MPLWIDGAQYHDRRFSRLSAQQTRFSTVEFRNCTFDRCALVQSAFYRCRFVGCAFSNCDLSVVQFLNSHLTGVRFTSSKLVGIDWTEAGDSEMSRLMISLDFDDCVLDYASFFGLSLRGRSVVRCLARETDFRDADAREADFSDTDLSGALFHHTNLSGANLTSARNYTIDPTANTITKARFSLPEAVSLLRGFDVVLE